MISNKLSIVQAFHVKHIYVFRSQFHAVNSDSLMVHSHWQSPTPTSNISIINANICQSELHNNSTQVTYFPLSNSDFVLSHWQDNEKLHPIFTIYPKTVLYNAGTFCLIKLAAAWAMWVASCLRPASMWHSINALKSIQFKKSLNIQCYIWNRQNGWKHPTRLWLYCYCYFIFEAKVHVPDTLRKIATLINCQRILFSQIYCVGYKYRQYWRCNLFHFYIN